MKHKKYITPCFILDETDFKKNVNGFQTALNKNFTKGVIGFSVKTNSFPFLLRLAYEQGCYAEVVSYTEYELALLCGYPKDKIIYNGPMKSKETFIDALENGAIVNIETKRETEWLKELDKTKHYNIGIRLNIDISRISPEDAKYDNDDSRFGFSAENNELEKAFETIEKLEHVSIKGLHLHRTSKTRSVTFYKKLVEYGISIISKFHLKLQYLDIGGGYFGIFGNKPTYEEYCTAISETLEEYKIKNITIIVEPGNALTASVFEYHSSVIDTKRVDDKLFITTDGTRNDIDPLFQKKDYIKEINYLSNNGQRINKQVITGCTCLEFDRLFEIENQPELKEGDEIIYKNVGAYTMCLSPLFIRYIPRVYSKLSGNILRKEWTPTEYVANCKL